MLGTRQLDGIRNSSIVTWEDINEDFCLLQRVKTIRIKGTFQERYTTRFGSSDYTYYRNTN